MAAVGPRLAANAAFYEPTATIFDPAIVDCKPYPTKSSWGTRNSGRRRRVNLTMRLVLHEREPSPCGAGSIGTRVPLSPPDRAKSVNDHV
jgi:hypothetical protein